MHFAHIDTYLGTICVGCKWWKMGNTSLDLKAFSEQLLRQQFHQRPVCTFQSIPRGERWSVALWGGGGKWQKIACAELTVKHGRGRVVVLWKCSAHYSALKRRTSPLAHSPPVPNFPAFYKSPHVTAVRGDGRTSGSDGCTVEATLRQHIKLK